MISAIFALACEQALLFGRVKRVLRERLSRQAVVTFLICGTFTLTVFTLCRVPGFPGWKWKFMRDRCKLSFLRSLGLASLAQIGELAPRLSLHMCKELCHVTLFHGLKLEKLDQLFKILILSLKNSFLEISKQQWIYPPVKKSCHCREVAVSRGLKFFLDHLTFILMS